MYPLWNVRKNTVCNAVTSRPVACGYNALYKRVIINVWYTHTHRRHIRFAGHTILHARPIRIIWVLLFFFYFHALPTYISVKKNSAGARYWRYCSFTPVNKIVNKKYIQRRALRTNQRLEIFELRGFESYSCMRLLTGAEIKWKIAVTKIHKKNLWGLVVLKLPEQKKKSEEETLPSVFR